MTTSESYEFLGRNGYREKDGYNFIGGAMFGPSGFYGPANKPLMPTTEASVGKNKIIMHVGLRVYEIRDVDAAGSCFTIKWRMIRSWHPDLSEVDDMIAAVPDGMSRYYVKENERERFDIAACTPKELYFFNDMAGQNNDNVTYDQPFVDMATKDVHQFVYGESKIRQSFDLKQFPLDCHELSLDLWNCFSGDKEHFDVVVHTIDLADGGAHMPEWSLHAPFIDRKSHMNTIIKLPLCRKPVFYFVNCILFLTAFNAMALTTLKIDVDETASRLSNGQSLVLIAVAFKLATSSTLPAVPYSTLLDAYILSSFALIFTLTMYSVFATEATDIYAKILFSIFAVGKFFAWMVHAWSVDRNIIAKYGSPLVSSSQGFLCWRFAKVIFLDSSTMEVNKKARASPRPGQ